MPTTDNTSSNKTRNVRAKVIYANYEIARQALLEGQSIRMPSAANADVSVLAAKAIGPIQFTPAEIAAVLQSTSIFPPTPSTTAPGPVRDLSGTAGNEEVVLTWAAPLNNGGSPITSYTVSWRPADQSEFESEPLVLSGPSPATTATITDLMNDSSYTFRVVATNSVGSGSPASVTVDTTAEVVSEWNVTRIAGGGTLTFPTNGFNGDKIGMNVLFNNLEGIAIDTNGILYVADSGNHRIRRIGTDLAVTTIAGDRTGGWLDATGTNSKFAYPTGITIDTNGILYVADSGNNRIRRIGTDLAVTTIAGDGTGSWLDDIGTNSKFAYPTGITIDTNGILYVVDSDNNVIRAINTSTYEVTTIAGGEGYDYPGNTIGIGTNAKFKKPTGITIDTNGTLYVADTRNHAIKKIT